MHYLVETLAPPPTMALLPVATVRSELGVDSSQDPKLKRLIAAMSRAFASPAGLCRQPLRGSWLEKTNGDGGHLLVLHRWPVESVSALTYGVEDPQSIDAAEYSIIGDHRRSLYRLKGWSPPGVVPAAAQAGGADLYTYAVTMVAGWVPPGAADATGTVSTWAGGTTYATGAFVKPVAGAGLLLFEATTGGASAASPEPTWPTTVGGTVVDGGVTWTARRASELPEDIQEVALVTVMDWFRGGLDRPAGIASESDGVSEISWDFVGNREAKLLPPMARAVLGGYR